MRQFLVEKLKALDRSEIIPASERLIEWLRGFGVTTMHTGHGPGALVSGQTMIVKTTGDEVDDAVVVPVAMVAVTIGDGALMEGGRAPGTTAKMVAMLRGEFLKAQEYDRKQQLAKEGERPARDLRMEMYARVLRRELPLLVTAERAQNIDPPILRASDDTVCRSRANVVEPRNVRAWWRGCDCGRRGRTSGRTSATYGRGA